MRGMARYDPMIRWTLVILIVVLCAACVRADFTFVQISDTHVGTKQAAFNARYQEVIRQVNALKPAFVIHTGDALTLWSDEDAALFKEINKSLQSPMYVAPGNHDILDAKKAGAGKVAEEINAWKQAIGPDRMSFEHDGCVFIGLNYTLWNTGYPAERLQLNWLKAQLAKSKGKRIFVFEHAPLFTKLPTDPNGNYYAVDNPARAKILDLLRAYKVEAVLTGHYHRTMEADFYAISFLTTPATSFSTGPDKGLTGYSVFTVSDGGFTHRFVDLRTKGTPPDFPNPQPLFSR